MAIKTIPEAWIPIHSTLSQVSEYATATVKSPLAVCDPLFPLL